MSSFKEKLERLHQSRRRARERADRDDEQGVYRADETEEHDEPPGAEAAGGRAAEEAENGRTSEPSGGERGGDDAGNRFELREHDYPASARHGAASFERLREAPIGDLVDTSPDPSRILFIDTETTGLGEDAYAFCIGWGRLDDESFCVRHALLTEPDGEPEVLCRFADLLADAELVCTYNGANFDLPLLERRVDEWGLDLDLRTTAHLDLLPVARARCPHLDAYRLSDVERSLLEFDRDDDLPGAEIPGIWKEYLEGAPIEVLEPVVRHNRLDVASLCVGLAGLAGRRPPSTKGSRASSSAAAGSSGDGAAESSSTPEGREVGDRLARSYSLRSRQRGGDGGEGTNRDAEVSRETSRAGRPSTGGEPASDGPGVADRPQEPPEERAERLRREAQQLLAEDNREEALDLLHELVAIHPRHSFALEELATYHERRGNTRLAKHFRSRLRDVAPY